MLDERGIPESTQREFEEFRKFMYERTGIDLGPNKRALVQSRLARRVGHLGLQSFASYWKRVCAPEGGAERQFVINALSTNETYFFREPDHFTWLANKARQHRAHSRQPFRVWSAACSSGEEAYSVAMVLCEELGAQSDFEVFASDVNTEVLRDARRAVYPEGRARQVPPVLFRRYFMWGREEYKGMLMVVPEVAQHVSFQQVNLLAQDNERIGVFDVIFLRNVMIYFDDNTKEQVVERISHCLREDGLLLIGHAETLNGIRHHLATVRASIYTRH